ncbi:MAG: purine-nucleoside phosphorylase [Candidatus Krumholzibacteriota bacterium]|nr:purine-nucleoside phosphorylase [Candidatus Krumholzibacteriota bacterium]
MSCERFYELLPADLVEGLEALRPRWSRLDVPAGTVGVILGSGLGPAADRFPLRWSLDFAELGLPPASVAGHAGRLALAQGSPYLFLQGRVHRYEGLPDARVLLPAAAMAGLGLAGMIVTNAAGGLDPSFRAGDFMLIRDILSMQLADPLRGAPSGAAPRLPPRRPLFDPDLSAALLAAAGEAGVAVHEGVLNAAPGPAYETRAELRLSRALGAQAASMSTFPECMLLSRLEMPLLGLSCITNEIVEDGGGPVSHEEVVAVGRSAAGDFARLLAALARRLPR